MHTLTHLGMLSRIIRRALIRFRLCLPGNDSGFFQVHEKEHRSFPPAEFKYWWEEIRIIIWNHPWWLTYTNCEQFPVTLPVHTRIRLYPMNQRAGHKDHVGRHSSNLSYVKLRCQVEGVRISDGVAEEVRVELLQDVRQSGGIAIIPLSTYAPAQTSVVNEQVHEGGGGCSSGCGQGVAHCCDYIDIS